MFYLIKNQMGLVLVASAMHQLLLLNLLRVWTESKYFFKILALIGVVIVILKFNKKNASKIILLFR